MLPKPGKITGETTADTLCTNGNQQPVPNRGEHCLGSGIDKSIDARDKVSGISNTISVQGLGVDDLMGNVPQSDKANMLGSHGLTVETSGYPEVDDPVDPARVLSRQDLTKQRIIFLGAILLLNIILAITAILGKESKISLAMIYFIKSKGFLSSIISPIGLVFTKVQQALWPPDPVTQRWILSLIPAYSESEEQIVKTIFSLRDNGMEPHRQVMVVILDGQPRDIRGNMTRVITQLERAYISFKWKRGTLRIIAGYMEDVPVIVLEKLKNGGKKDSLILCHDLFNCIRPNAPIYTKLLREEIWNHILPSLLPETDQFQGFDMVFCTDADSTIHKGALAKLANALCRNKNAIAACGLVLVELEPGYEWSVWNLYQQFQYTFGQYVRRRAEHYIGKVTCLPGCITMISVREEMGGAIQKYAEPITGALVLSHQVQYLGTDRRLTYSMLSQGKHLHTLFVPDAVSETVAPQSIQHYLSQRRRWGSNAYFNNYFYLGGERMILITRIAATIEVVRLSLVYYRVLNTIMFFKRVSHGVPILKLIPMLVIGQLPSCWFFCSVMIERELRRRAPWGMSGVTASSAPAAATADAGGLTDNNTLSASAVGALEAQVDAAITASRERNNLEIELTGHAAVVLNLKIKAKQVV
ncbi:chitin synthase [Fusarium circinatum]|uniref:chitin synthase n=1 Tax=Fusarium circinatum TaxID=48490 RepID=A0A8H5T975_FUSCI|nr:chitin synthase [Fusarium circinatum]